ncbi:beta-1,6-N-acetylglucosaminyltransferase [uncultured Aquimarina sp.]|uniref:beta-1,6-N-acetylglucosaminyltransferase n=1 Tax=uncultured Aquimarina sp. TaxID=575652 RepID=UPI00261FD51B|nr:beta-1,6-N-acetylglucosaminyltransferase [uncultured Aquimarina sp.]
MTKKIHIAKKQSFHFNIPKSKPKIAYFILAHRFPKQFRRLFKTIYHPGNHYLIHIDQESDASTKKGIKTFLEDYSNAYILRSENVVCGGYSRVQSEINGMKYLLKRCLKWDFFINLSDQDFPLKSNNFIFDFLGKNIGKNFMKIANQIRDRPDTMNRIENYFHETDIGFSGIPYQRSFMKNVTPYIGGQWMILTRTCCEFICYNPEVKKFEDFYHNIWLADESFFQTVLMNTSFKETIVNDDKRAIIWMSDEGMKLKPKTLTGSDIDFLMQGDNLFAREFDENIDVLVLDFLEESIKADPILNNAINIDFNLIPTHNMDTKKSVVLSPETIINPPTQLRKLNGNK